MARAGGTKAIPTRAVLGAALGVATLGTAYAANVYLTPAKYTGPDTNQIRALAERIQGVKPPLGATLAVPAAAAGPAPRARSQRLRPVVQIASADTGSGRHSAMHPVVTRPANPAAPDDPVKNIALMGVTYHDGHDEAWLVDLNSRSRETVAPGESAFGFTVKEIEPESVVLARGGDEFELRLGEKQIPIDPETEVASGGTAGLDDAGPGGFGRRNRGNFGGFGGFNGFNGFNGGGRNRRNFGGFNGGGRNRGNLGGFNAASFGGNRGNFGGNFNRGGFGGAGNFNRGGFTPAAFNRGGNFGGGGYGGGFGGYGNQNQRPAPTSNPQTARRNGARLVGGAQAMPTPGAIRNPQTLRRTGSNTGSAFGQNGGYGGGYGGYGNYGGGNSRLRNGGNTSRTGGFGGR